MIFYDASHKRKIYVRASLVILLILAILGYLHFQNIISTHRTGAVNIATAQSTSTSTPKQLVLTFDDGPHPVYTREILKILEAHNVPAVFFFVGEEILKHPELLTQVYEAGHEIGNHSHTHEWSVHESQERIKKELLFTNKLIEQYTGRSSRIYRPPFLLDLQDTESEIIFTASDAGMNTHLLTIHELGFITVGAKIDSRDWNSNSSSQIIENTITSLDNGNLILLHDGGVNRALTQSTLPYLITELQDRGYEFVSLAELTGVDTDVLMPPRDTTGLIGGAERAALAGYLASSRFVPNIITFLIFVSIFRIILLLTLLVFVRHKKHSKWTKGVSILVPAFNEENNISGTIRSVARSTHYPREIIVIDDGSSDKTVDIVRGLMQELNEDITLVKKKNGGKASALNKGLEYSKYEILLTIDSDTVIGENAVAHMASHFNEPSTGAVAGKVVPTGKMNILRTYQDLEYTVAQNIDKTALTALGVVGVVPGAIGAWRRSDLLRSGGYSSDTLVEDQDLTFAMHVLDKKIVYEPRGVAFTEAPAKTAAFVAQRFRWIFGNFQCLWKYRRSFFSTKQFLFGWVLLPYNFLYIVVVPFLWPVLFALLIATLWSGYWGILLASLLVFLLIDILYCAIGFSGEQKKSILLFVLPFQRIYYRVVVSFVLILCFVRIIEGTRTYWKKLEREGSAQRYFERNTVPIQVTPTAVARM